MNKILIFFCCLTGFSSAQNIQQCKQRFDNYLNFKGSLNNLIKFEPGAIYILNTKGEKEIAIYENEINMLASFFENSSLKEQEKLIKLKGLKKYNKKQHDSIFIAIDDKRPALKSNGNTLKGYRIALDPGHFAVTLTDSKIEQKYLYFVKDSINHPTDSIKLFESSLTFNTASILKKMLEEQGAEVLVTRDKSNHTSLNCTYNYWLKTHKKRVLDSLKTAGYLPAAKYNKLVKSKDYAFFWDFFRDYDLANRANKINKFSPHASIVIHYNVDEKNDPWQKTTSKNYCMAFIGGAFTADNLEKTESKLNFLRLLLTDQLNRSQDFAEETVLNFNRFLNIPIAGKTDADYLNNNCVTTTSQGVFCRNLILCRKINSVLVYGESLYQDNEKEAEQLMRLDTELYGVTSNARLINVAKSYYEAVLRLLKNY